MINLPLMTTRKAFVLLGLLVLLSVTKLAAASIDRSDFPREFYFGTSTSAYQVEGAANKSCRGPSVWDTFAHDEPDRIRDGNNGDVAVDFYNLYKEDLKSMKEIGFNAFRFSISWSRIIPHGKIRSGVNEEGIRFYNKLINESLANGIEPFVTLFHWDTPQALEDRYGGFLSPQIVDDFRDYAELCFQRFGDRVKHWITLNEPSAYASFGYDNGEFAPGRCSSWKNRQCKAGNSATEPYIVTHHQLLSHAAAVDLYRRKYKESQKGVIGITLVTWWMEPYSNRTSDQDAAKRALDFRYGWYMDPLVYGDYPRTMRDYVKERLPTFKETEANLVKKSFDFIGLNYYSARYVKKHETFDPERVSYATDVQASLLYENSEGHSIGPPAGLDWLRVAPFGIRYLLNYTKDNYKNPLIFVTENGMAHDDSTSHDNIIHDTMRIKYYESHLGNLSISMNNYNVNVKGYFAWSFMDNFEWSSGYTKRFGLVYIDYHNNLTRIPKDSAKWFQNMFSEKSGKRHSRPFGFLNKPV